MTLSLFDIPREDGVTKSHQSIEPHSLWQLGNHRLLCDDTGNSKAIRRLLGKAEGLHTVFTDPPYNVKVESRATAAMTNHTLSVYLRKRRKVSKRLSTGSTKQKNATIHNDALTDEEFEELLNGWIANISEVLLPGRALYMWGGYTNIGTIPRLLEKNDIHWHQPIVWYKISPMLGRTDFLSVHEWCFYSWKKCPPGTRHVFVGATNVPDVWSMRTVHRSKTIHITEKPIGLAIRGLECSTRKGEIVGDFFGGSGSTLMAAEQLGRRCFVMEIEPAYCSLIIARWERWTGQKAKRIN